jgi:hypothetical protein
VVTEREVQDQRRVVESINPVKEPKRFYAEIDKLMPMEAALREERDGQVGTA